jgi:tRNA threonylcarbamoyl adenosine modification protein (Sua5/YciO/YrdC/YwlC family)
MIFKEAKIYKLKDSNLSQSELKELAEFLRKGELIIFPTETVYGLGCLYTNETGKMKIFELKKRKPEKKLPIMVKDIEMIESFFKCHCSPLANDIMRKFMPGPITIILNCKSGNSYGFRIPALKFILDLISVCKQPLVATSANLSEREPNIDFQKVLQLFSNKVAAMVDGGRCRLGKPSTVIDLKYENNFKVLREGVYEENLIKAALSNPKNILFVCTGNSCRSIIAACLLEKELQERKNFDIRVTSAGTAALEGILPSQDTIKVLGEVGIEADKYRSRRLTEEMLKEADLVLTMEKIHLDYILAQDMQLKCKTFGFLKFAFGLEDEVQDPIGKGIDEYRKVFFLIKEAVAEIIKKIT